MRFLAAEGWRDSSQTVTHTVARPPVGEGVPVHYKFDEGTGTTSVNSGSDPAIGNAVLQGNAGWVSSAKYGAGLNLPGAGHVQLPNDITEGMEEEITISTWIRPTNLPNWTTHAQIGKGQNEFLLLQSSWDNGTRGFVVTLRNDNGEQYRTALPGETDLPMGEWTHVAVTMGPSPTGTGSTVKIYFNGELMAGGTRDNIPVMIGDLTEGGTNANFIGNGSWPDPRPTEQQDDFRIYGFALSAEDVLAVYNATSNVAPVGVPDSYTTAEGETLSVDAPGVLDNDTDAEGDDLTATSATPAGNGSVAITTASSVSGRVRGIYAQASGSGSLTINANNSVSTTTTVVLPNPSTTNVGQIAAIHAVAGSGLTTINIGGTFGSVDGRGASGVLAQTSGDIILDINAGRSVTGGFQTDTSGQGGGTPVDWVVELNTVAGRAITIDNAGTIQSVGISSSIYGHKAIQAAGGSLVLNNTGLIAGQVDFSGVSGGVEFNIAGTTATQGWWMTGESRMSSGSDALNIASGGFLNSALGSIGNPLPANAVIDFLAGNDAVNNDGLFRF